MTQVTAVRGFRQWPACPPRHDEAANHADSASRAARQLGSMPRDSNPTAAAGWAGPGVKPNAASSVRRRFMTTRPPGVSRCNTLGYWGVGAARRGTGSRHVTFPLQVPRGSSIQRPPGAQERAASGHSVDAAPTHEPQQRPPGRGAGRLGGSIGRHRVARRTPVLVPAVCRRGSRRIRRSPAPQAESNQRQGTVCLTNPALATKRAGRSMARSAECRWVARGAGHSSE